MRATILLLSLLAPAAFADTTLVYQDDAGQDAFTLKVHDGSVRLDQADAGSGSILFKSGEKSLTILDPESREYIVFDEAAIAALREQIAQALAMAERFGMSLDELGLDGADAVEPDEVRTGESKTVHGRECTVYRYEIDGAVDGYACLADPDDVGVPAADWQAMQTMYSMMMDLASDMLPGDSAVDFALPSGLMVEAHDADGGERQVLAAVDHAGIDASAFEVPAGWKQRTLGPMGH